MKHSKASRLAVATLGLVLMAPWFANAQPVDENPSALAMIGDLVIARPLLVVATAAGAAAFLVSLPFTATGGNMDQAADTLQEQRPATGGLRLKPGQSGRHRRSNFSSNSSRLSGRAGSSGMQSTGHTLRHCGSSKCPTHSVQRAGSIS